MLFAFLDTTALHRAYTLRGTQWDSVEQAITLGLARVVTSDISVAEIVRQVGPEARELNNRLSAAARDAALFGVDLTPGAVPESEERWNTAFRKALEERGIMINSHARPPHSEILARDLSTMPPFKKSGEGYRDTLIWLTFLEWLSACKPGEGDLVF